MISRKFWVLIGNILPQHLGPGDLAAQIDHGPHSASVYSSFALKGIADKTHGNICLLHRDCCLQRAPPHESARARARGGRGGGWGGGGTPRGIGAIRNWGPGSGPQFHGHHPVHHRRIQVVMRFHDHHLIRRPPRVHSTQNTTSTASGLGGPSMLVVAACCLRLSSCSGLRRSLGSLKGFTLI